MAGALGRVHGEVCGAALAFPGGAPAVLPGVMERVSADELDGPAVSASITEGRGRPTQGLPDQAASVFPLRHDPACLRQETLKGW